VCGSRSGIRPSNHTRQLAVAELAGRQRGRVAHSQLIDLGLSPSAIKRWVAAGRLHPEHRGVYAVGHRATGHLGRWMGGVLACGPGAVLSHHNAAAHLGLRPMSSAAIHVTTTCHRRPKGIRVHRVRQLHTDDFSVVEDIPTTSVARTCLDMAEVLALRQTVRMLEQSERLGVFDLMALEQLMDHSHGRRGVKPLGQALEAINDEPPFVNSGWERDLLDFCDDWDIPRPELNVIVEDYLVDALWRAAKVIVELDSWAHHRSRTAFEDDRERDCALDLAGYRVLRITWRRLRREPQRVAEQLRRRVAA
jgi:hypothetical protein